MSRIRAAAEMMKNLPGRGQDISKQVLGNPGRRQTNLDALLRGQPGNLSLPGSYATRDLSKGAALGLTTGMGLGGGLGMSDLTEGFTESAKLENSIFANPEELGRQAARAKMSLEELMDKARQEAEKAARAAKRAAKNGGTKGGAAKEDIFDAFDQKMRGGNANDIISEFKNRHNKGRRSNLGKPEKSGVGGAMRNELAAVLGRRR